MNIPPTTNHPLTTSSDPQSLFYSDGGLPVRLVTASELQQNWVYRPISIIKPGSKNVISQGRFSEFERGIHRVVTILKPDEQLNILWAFKQDAGSDDKGESSSTPSETGNCKKMNDLSLLSEKMTEQAHRKRSVFLPYTSGHVDYTGFIRHKHQQSRYRTDSYPELICRLNPRQMHGGYLLDPKREVSFQRISGVMANILAMEQANGNGNSDAFREPVTLCMYDSYRGRLMAPEKLDRSTIKTMQENANALAQYEQSMDIKGNLYGLLAQSGCDRFLSVLKEIPENVRQLAQASMTCLKGDLGEITKELAKAIEELDARRFHDLLSSVDKTLLNHNGLPEYLLNVLLLTDAFTYDQFTNAYQAERFTLEYTDNNHLERLMKETFPNQAEICHTLLKHGLFFPVISCYQGIAPVNPLVVCLLIAHGSRAHAGSDWKLVPGSAMTVLYSANKFLHARLLSEEQVRHLRHDVLLDSLCYEHLGIPCASGKITSRFRYFVVKLQQMLVKECVEGGSPAANHIRAETMCRELLGDELWGFYCAEHVDGSTLKSFLERGLSPQRYSDDELRQYLEWLKYAEAKHLPCSYESRISIGGARYEVENRVVTRGSGQPEKAEWLSSLLATPPSFDRCEFARVGRYRAINQMAGQHYYQYHHPSRAHNALTCGTDYVHRRYHGIDHALRSQMATEFLIEILPFYHSPFRQLLETYPDLAELLTIAELYHDAVAEDEPKETEELRAAELFERDMRALREYPDELITLVATALKNKNSNEMSMVQAPFTADDQCSGEELLLRQVLRFGDVVEILRLVPLQENFLEVNDHIVANPPSREPDKFDPQAIELLAVVNNPMFTRSIKAALLTFRDLAALTGGWHFKTENPVEVRYQLKVDNLQRRLLVEHSPEPYTLMREVLDDLVRLKIARKAGIGACHNEHQTGWSLSDCWDETTGVAGTYRKLHSEGELRQVRVPENMTLCEKVCFVAELPDEDRLALSFITGTGIENEIHRLRQKGIQPATGTPSQDELEQLYERPHSLGGSILADRGIVVQKAEHEGRAYFRMMKSEDGSSLDS